MAAVLLSCEPQSLENSLATYSKTITIDAVYDKYIVKGSVATFVTKEEIEFYCGGKEDFLGVKKAEAIGINKVNIHTLELLFMVFDCKPKVTNLFWEYAKYIEGDDKPESTSPENLIKIKKAYCTYKTFANRINENEELCNNKTTNITSSILEILNTFILIQEDLESKRNFITSLGDNWSKVMHEINTSSFRYAKRDYIVRVTSENAEDLFTYNGKRYSYQIVYNPIDRRVTLYTNKRINQNHALWLAQMFWGNECEGGPWIGKSPAGIVMTANDIKQATYKLEDYLDYTDMIDEMVMTEDGRGLGDNKKTA